MLLWPEVKVGIVTLVFLDVESEIADVGLDWLVHGCGEAVGAGAVDYVEREFDAWAYSIH